MDECLCCSKSVFLQFKSNRRKTSRWPGASKNPNPVLCDEFLVRQELFTLKSIRNKGRSPLLLRSEGGEFMKREKLRTMQTSQRWLKAQENEIDARKRLSTLKVEKCSFTQTLHHHGNSKPEQDASHMKEIEKKGNHLREDDVTRHDVMEKSLNDTGIYTSSTNNIFPDYFPDDLVRTFVPVKTLEGKTLSKNCYRLARSKTEPNIKYCSRNCPQGDCTTRRKCIKEFRTEMMLNSSPPCLSHENLNDGKESRRNIASLSLSLPCLKACPQCCQLQELEQNIMTDSGGSLMQLDQAQEDVRGQESQPSKLGPVVNFNRRHIAKQDIIYSLKSGKKSDSELKIIAKSNPSSFCSEDAFSEQYLSGLSHQKSLSDQKRVRGFLAKDSVRVIKMIFFTQMLFIVCLAPGFFLCLLYGLTNVPVWLINWAPFTAFLNSAMNIFVYVSCKSRYRVAIWSILKCGHGRSKGLTLGERPLKKRPHLAYQNN